MITLHQTDLNRSRLDIDSDDISSISDGPLQGSVIITKAGTVSYSVMESPDEIEAMRGGGK